MHRGAVSLGLRGAKNLQLPARRRKRQPARKLRQRQNTGRIRQKPSGIKKKRYDRTRSTHLLTDALVNLFEIEPERIKPETNLYEDLEIDSIDAIDLIDHIKRETGCKLQAEDFRNVRTVDDVVQAVLKVQAQDS